MTQAAPRVLVVDDERHVRGMLRDLLTVWGCQAEEAADATEGLLLLKRGGYDLVLTDYLMPGVSGLQLIETVRNSGAQVGVIMLTASPKDLTAERERLNFRLLRKPLEITSLHAAVKEALQGAVPPHDDR
jgi:DNA-binding response OmpR family regulator